jgi:hypothetical protein
MPSFPRTLLLGIPVALVIIVTLAQFSIGQDPEPTPTATEESHPLIDTGTDPTEVRMVTGGVYENPFLGFAVAIPPGWSLGEKVSYIEDKTYESYELTAYDSNNIGMGLVAYTVPIEREPEGRDGFWGDVVNGAKGGGTLYELCDRWFEEPCTVGRTSAGIEFVRVETEGEWGSLPFTVTLFKLKAESDSWRVIAFADRDVPLDEKVHVPAFVDSFRYLK